MEAAVTNVASFMLLVAALLMIVAAVQPLAAWLRLPPTVLLAGVGMALGFLAHGLAGGPRSAAVDAVVQPIVNLPVGSAVFLYVFLPLLLFQACISLDVRRMADDIVPILVLAVLAVVLTAAVIGLSLEALFGLSLTAALLLGAIVATTDPAAVVAIFRTIGAPARLTRLVEGESLLNDAAAIALFSLLLAALVSGAPLDPLQGLERLLTTLIGGSLAGYAGGRAVVSAARLARGLAAAELTLTLAAAYLIFLISELWLGISGIVAVVVTGLTVSVALPARVAPRNWRHICAVWEQIAFWASSLVFLLAAILVPRFLLDATFRDLLVVLALVGAALVARAAILFAVLPVLERLRLADHVSARYRTAILWGGLRGAVTLALALAVTENRALPSDVKELVGIGASGFVLFTLFVNGLTIKPMIRWLELDRLSPVDLAMRNQVRKIALADVADRVQEVARQYDIEPRIAREVASDYARRASDPSGEAGVLLTDRERLIIGLVSLAAREKELILHHHGQRTIRVNAVGRMLRHAERLIERARSEGRSGYMRAARRPLGFGAAFRVAYLAHRYLRSDRLLRLCLARRFETLLVLSMVVAELREEVPRRLGPLLGVRVAELLGDVLRRRHGDVRKALEALRLQYPGYAEALERTFLLRIGEQQELGHYEELWEEGLLAQEVHENLRRAVLQRTAALPGDAHLEIRLDVATMIRALPIFEHLDEDQLRALERLTRPRFVLPGKTIVRRGETKRLSLYFIASGAVEVRLPEQAVRLGPGDFFGEMALLFGQPRSSDVVALSFCHLLSLSEQHFQRFLRQYPQVERKIEETAAARARQNKGFPGEEPPRPQAGSLG